MPGLESVLRPCPILLIVPPLHWINRPHLGAHLLQGLARRAGHDLQVIYANILFAAQIGERSYDALSTVQYGMFLGERLFARTAYGLPRLGRDGGENLALMLQKLTERQHADGVEFDITVENFIRLEEMIGPWVQSIAGTIAGGPRIVGSSTAFEQTAASFALLGAIKELAPSTVTILGGPNCEGPMAAGMLSLSDAVDYVFSGESETTFPAFVEAVMAGKRPAERILDGRPCEDLDALPIPDYEDYYTQLETWLPAARYDSILTFESSRGCWWGEKKHCTFCGLNGQGMASREKSADRTITELQSLLSAHPNRRVTVTDNIMPHSFWKTVVPRLPTEVPGLEMMYEQKANLSLAQMRALAAAGITEIQPGIEALSTGLLKLMDKGTTAAQNLALLRYAEACGIELQWNLLYGFPGDSEEHYRETLALLPLLHHLPPPHRAGLVIVDRFSPYHTHPARYGVTDLKPLSGFTDTLPLHADVNAVCYHFTGTFETAVQRDPSLADALERGIAAWRADYYGASRPLLCVRERRDHTLELVDTRGLPGTTPARTLTESDARLLFTLQRWEARLARELAWALDAQLFVVRDDRFVPLATAEPALFARLSAAAPSRAQLVVV